MFLQASINCLLFWLLQSQRLYSDKFRGSGNGNSPTHQLESSAEGEDNGGSSCCALSGQVSTSCASSKGEECVKPETCSNPKNLVDSSSTLKKENGKEEESKSSQTLDGS